MTGDAWYESKAMHAVAQALGRCIRHPGDFGALVLLDSRWAELGKASQLPKWLQPFLVERSDADGAAQLLREHFRQLGVQVREKEEMKDEVKDEVKDEMKGEMKHELKEEVLNAQHGTVTAKWLEEEPARVPFQVKLRNSAACLDLDSD